MPRRCRFQKTAALNVRSRLHYSSGGVGSIRQRRAAAGQKQAMDDSERPTAFGLLRNAPPRNQKRLSASWLPAFALLIEAYSCQSYRRSLLAVRRHLSTRPQLTTAAGGQPCEFSEPGRLFSHQDQSRGSSEKGSSCASSRAAQIGCVNLAILFHSPGSICLRVCVDRQ